MEELALLDLLECPLCFERLDVTAKVLPCQHTFCKPCLQKLASSRSELCCPECRMAVSEGVEELPANLLLVRLLEGLRQGSVGRGRDGSVRYFAQTAQNLSMRSTRDSRYAQPRLTQSRRNPLDGVPWARALYNYRGNIPGELKMKSGDIIILRRKVDENWYHGETNGNSGLVPASMVHVVNHLPQPLPLCRALYDFDLKAKDKEDNKDFLTFLKGDIITVIRRVDENWVEGQLGDKIGIFPVQFTQLLGKRKASGSQDPRQWTLSSNSSGGGVGSGSSDSGSRWPSSRTSHNPPGPPATSTLNRLNVLSQGPTGDRQPPSISPPTFLGSSNPATVAQLSERHSGAGGSGLLQGSASVPGERNPSCEPPPTITMALINRQSPSATAESRPSSTQQLSISVCAALYSYSPRRVEELELHKGEMVGVYGKFKEGWLRGLSLRTGKLGILQANYVTPVLRTSARFLDTKCAPPTLSTVVGKRPGAAKTQAAIVASDRVTTNGTIRSAGQVAMTTAPAMSSASVVRAAQPEGVQGRGSVRRAFHSPHRVLSGSSMQGNLSSPLPTSVAVRPQQLQPSGGLVQSHGRGPFTSRTRNSLPTNTTRPLCWISEAGVPSGGDSLTLDRRDSTGAKEVSDKPFTMGPQSILVKPDFHRNNSEKPTKSVRFLTQEAPTASMKACTPSIGGQSSPVTEPGVPVLEAWGSQSSSLHMVAGSSLKEGKMPIHKRGMSTNPINADSPPPGRKTSTSSNPQSSTRYRVVTAYPAQSDAELYLKEGELVLVQRPRQDGRMLVTQEKSGITGFFQNSVLDALEKL